MKRFFLKKSVAIILTTILFVGFFCCNISTTYAADGSTSSGIFDALGGIAKGIANYSVGAANLETFVPVVATLHVINTTLGALVPIMGALFDFSVSFGILNIKDFFVSGGVVDVMWTMVRDTINITFIFVLLYISITKIIGSWGIKAKSTLISVITSVIFINFSMFITKILIDVGNYVAIQLYNMISPITLGSSISSLILSGSGLVSTLKSTVALTGQVNTTIYLILQIIAVLILVWVFFLGAMLIVGRTVTLIFLTIVSPIGFIGSSVPGFDKLSEKWWTALTNQILVAPALMFLLLFVTRLVSAQSIMLAANSSKNNSWFTFPAIDVSGFFSYVMIIIVLWQGIKLVKSLSGTVGEMTVKVFKAAAAAGAIAVTAGAAGAALGAGALGEGAAGAATAAANAGKGKIGQAMARLTFSGKNLMSKEVIGGKGQQLGGAALKFATGSYDKTGIGGMAQGIARDKIMSGIKDATVGTVDLKLVEKMLTDSTKESKKNLNDKVDSFTKGPKEKIKQNDAMEDRINKIGATAATHVVKGKEFIDAETDLEKTKNQKDVAETDTTEKEKILKKAQGDYKKNPSPVTQTALNFAEKEHAVSEKLSAQANNDFSHAEAIVENFQRDYAKKQKIEQDKAMEDEAQKMGMVATEIYEAVLDANGNPVIDSETGEKEMRVAGKSFVKAFEDMKADDQTKLTAAEVKRDEFITDNIENGNYWDTLLFGGTRKKLAKEVRTRVGSENGEEKSIKEYLKFMKDQKENPDAGKTPPKP